jgi:hypothetical protein
LKQDVSKNFPLNNKIPVLPCCLSALCISALCISALCSFPSLQRWLGLTKQDKGDKPAYVAFKY